MLATVFGLFCGAALLLFLAFAVWVGIRKGPPFLERKEETEEEFLDRQW